MIDLNKPHWNGIHPIDYGRAIEAQSIAKEEATREAKKGWSEKPVGRVSRINMILIVLISMLTGQIIGDFAEGFRKGWNAPTAEAAR